MHKLIIPLFLTILASALSGCVQIQENNTSLTPQPAPTSLTTPEATPLDTPPVTTPASIPLQYGVRYTVKVVHVVDGDTMDILMPDGSKERIRILGIDTPEKVAGGNKPEEYDKISDVYYLAYWGQIATDRAEKLLEGETAEIEFDSVAGMRGYYGRLLAYIYIDGQDFGALMINEGLARTYVEGRFKKESYYIQLQQWAVANKTGLWNYTPPEIEIATVNYDACGKTDDRECLNDEYVVIVNSGVTPASLYLWKLEDEAKHYYLFPDMVIEPEQNITVHTGTGSDNSTHLFWNSGNPVWNNDHDIAYLYNAKGELVDSYSW